MTSTQKQPLKSKRASSTRSAVAVIPAYNEAKTIADIVGRTACVIERVIVIDDGSTDDTRDSAEALGIEVLCHNRNRGKGESLLTGIGAASNMGCDFVVTLDADGQHAPEYILKLMDQAGPGTIVVGSRLADPRLIPKARYWANQTANFFISWAARHWIQDTQSGFRVYPMALFDRVRLRRNRRSGFVAESEILIEACRAGYRVASVPIPALYGTVLRRPSHFRPVRDTTAIAIMVAGKLLARGTDPAGLIISHRERRNGALPAHKT